MREGDGRVNTEQRRQREQLGNRTDRSTQARTETGLYSALSQLRIALSPGMKSLMRAELTLSNSRSPARPMPMGPRSAERVAVPDCRRRASHQ